MKKKFIYILIAVITSALLGLVAIQLYWIDSAVALREDEFSRDVKSALFAVTSKLEKIEALNRVKIHQKSQQLFNQKAKLLYSMQQTTFDTSAYFEKDGVKYRVNEQHQQIANGKVYQKTVESVSDNGSEFQMSIGVQGGLPITNYSSEDSLLNYQQNEKLMMLDEMLKSIYQTSQYRPILERVNKQILDSLLKLELIHRDIKATFQYGVFDYDGNGLLVDSLSNINKIRQSNYYAQLFPNDILETPHFLSIYFPHQKGYLLKTMWLMLLTSVLLLIIIVLAFTYTIQTIFKQKKLSEVKNDFISNMTHELKTPISTISLACEALSDKDISANPSINSNYINMISQENKRLGLLVESVLKSAMWDKELKLKKETFNLHDVINQVTSNILIQVESKKGKISKNLAAKEYEITADKVHITNLIYNLLDNANKYSPKEPDIIISTENYKQGILVSVSDNGVGIKKENVNKIFEKFYRVPTGNVHNVKGFGLGLNYVKALVDKHGGEIQVVSEFGVGTTFKVYLPFKNNENN
jgi:two-component system, OmpR family, phosphate regulon sensor histidine kinase PhoR